MTLAQRVGDRIFSRLNEMCTFVKLDPGMDLRKDRAGSGSFWSGR
jgi:DNA replication protein DnaC